MENYDVVNCGDNLILLENKKFYQFIYNINTKTKIKIGRRNGISAAPILGTHYGSSWEVSKGKLIIYKEHTFEDVGNNAEVDGKDNSRILDTNTAQKLSAKEIEQMQKEGVQGSTIVQALISHSETWDQKTGMAKAKYLRKKIEKHVHIVEVIKPSAYSIARAYFSKAAPKIHYLRYDTLARLLADTSIRSGMQVTVYDKIKGLIVGSVAERLGGTGRVINVYSGLSPSEGIIKLFNNSKAQHSTIRHYPLSKIQTLTEEFKNRSDPNASINMEVSPLESITNDNINRKDGETILNQNVSKLTPEKLLKREQRRKELRSLEDETGRYLMEQSDAMIIVENNRPLLILKLLYPFLAPGRSFALYSQYPQVLAECLAELSENNAALHLRVYEQWLREYQVLPQRTHPEINMSNASGFVLSGIKLDSNFGLTTQEVVEPPSKLTKVNDQENKQ
eukprot:TRINITY_DN4588_c0_g1_i1.p1 TRINITY_DN4588_c0_g1~~TRINITY_DN4588_c0_g1_i1.p1  ORF type:complete len:450 (+),score=56.46 TRINITY_DN4588_c0_g1_i1:71-1420(+)